jgi:hypothetical protein
MAALADEKLDPFCTDPDSKNRVAAKERLPTGKFDSTIIKCNEMRI